MVETGLDVFIRDPALVGEPEGLLMVSNHSAVSADLVHLATVLATRYGERFKGIISPEHGFLGSEREGHPVGNSTDPMTGRPVYSWYGEKQNVDERWLQGIDTIFYDIQDGGVRFHTYLSTLRAVMESAAKKSISLVVLDRPDPITGDIVEGNVSKSTSIVGAWTVPIRYGLTVGEFALLLNQEEHLNLDLKVIPMKGWKRSMWYDETGLPWVPISPNTPSLTTSTLYPGTCLFEGTALSVGRGTTIPFELLGAPWVDGRWLQDEVNAIKLPGARARWVFFTPNFNKYAGEVCQGVQIHVTDRNAVRPTHVSVYILSLLVKRYGCEKVFGEEGRHFDTLAGDKDLRKRICDKEDPGQITSSWNPDISVYEERINGVKLYADHR